jgi:hypothetical protein
VFWTVSDEESVVFTQLVDLDRKNKKTVNGIMLFVV